MRNVNRPSEPESLRRLGKRWTGSLLKKKAECNKRGENIPDSYFDKYKNYPDIRETLETMYAIDHNHGPLCCYCESKIKDKGEIEHIKPKRRFLDNAYDWNNLHLACRECNKNKGEIYNDTNEILDPFVDNPISDHLCLGRWETDHSFDLIPRSERGETTIELPKLARRELVNARRKMHDHVSFLIERIKNSDSSKHRLIQKAQEELRELRTGKAGYVSVVEYVIRFADAEALL